MVAAGVLDPLDPNCHKLSEAIGGGSGGHEGAVERNLSERLVYTGPNSNVCFSRKFT